ALYASDGGGTDRPCVVTARGVALSGSAMATATDGLGNGVGEDRRVERLKSAEVCSDAGQEGWARGGKQVSRGDDRLIGMTQTGRERSRNIIRRHQVRDQRGCLSSLLLPCQPIDQ